MSQIEELQQQFQDARAAAEAYSAAVTERYRQEMPGTDDATIVERARAWTPEESAELDRLRTVAREAAVAWHRARQAGDGA